MFDALRATIDGTVIQPGDPDYDDARKPALDRLDAFATTFHFPHGP